VNYDVENGVYECVNNDPSLHHLGVNIDDLEGICLSVQMNVYDHPLEAIIDTGAERSLISKQWVQQIGISCVHKPPVRLKGVFNN